MSKLIISIEPPLRCQFSPECGQQAAKAIVWTNGIVPTRWVMMPVCSNCLSAAKVMYPLKNGDIPGQALQLVCPKAAAPESSLQLDYVNSQGVG